MNAPNNQNDNNSKDSVVKEIISRVKEFYSDLDFAHDLEHGKRVVYFAKKINEKELGDPFLVEAGAWLHQYHDNLDDLQSLLNDLEISSTERDALFKIVELCRPNKITEEASIEAKIVFDADALELIGPYGTIRELLCNAVARNLPWDQATKSAQEVQNLFVEKLMTDTAKELAQNAHYITTQFWQVYNDWKKLQF